MSTATTYLRSQLEQYGVQDHHQFVAEWIADDQQSAAVVGLGATAADALADAITSADRDEYQIEGGKIVISEIRTRVTHPEYDCVGIVTERDGGLAYVEWDDGEAGWEVAAELEND
jgi:hypothetical protein